jgi:hypothetical protein
MLTVAGFPIVSLTLVLPLIGAWHADLVVSTEQALESPLVITDGTNSFNGTIVPNRSGFQGARFTARVVGGAGGLSKPLNAAHYRTAKTRLIVSDILSAAGERGSAESDGATLEREVAKWSRAGGSTGGTAGASLSTLAERLAVSWRVLPDGSVWFGPDTFPELAEPIEAPALEPDPIDGSRVIATELLQMRPGITHAGARVTRVVHTSSGGTLRTQYWTA